MEPLTKNQYKTLQYLKQFYKKKGYMPSIKELTDKFQLSAISTGWQRLMELEKKGWIERKKNVSRYIIIK